MHDSRGPIQAPPSPKQRFNNMMQLLKCICDILAAFNRNFQLAANLVDLIANIVYCL